MLPGVCRDTGVPYIERAEGDKRSPTGGRPKRNPGAQLGQAPDAPVRRGQDTALVDAVADA